MSTSLSVIASVSGCACRGSRRLPQPGAPEPRKRSHRENAELPHAAVPGRRRETARGVLRLPQPLPRLPARSAPQAAGLCCRTMPALPANPHSPLVSRQPGVSRFLKQARPDLFPGDDIGRVLLVASDAVIKLCPLRIRQGSRVRFQAFPDRIQQFCLLRSGETVYPMSQIAHTAITLARFLRSGKHTMRLEISLWAGGPSF